MTMNPSPEITALATLPGFSNQNLEVIELDGERFVTLRAIGRALGHADPIDCRKIIERHADEFAGKVRVFSLSTIKGQRNCPVINFRGVIRLAMLSNAPRAIEFRDWAEQLLCHVMKYGYYFAGPGDVRVNIIPAQEAKVVKYES
ncbi:MAG: hypothetical protein HY914_10075 [Desulfomonile tiedjei]|nr:hypothetical protein [Desulfomonile tiedjei]